MKNNYIKLLSVILLLFIYSSSNAQLKISGEVRPRTEMENGYKSLRNQGDESLIYISQRTRVNLDYSNEMVKFGVVLQDIRQWGGTPQLATTDPFLAVHQAWAEILFNQNFSLKLGRQELVYDDHRIFGSVAWAQQARSHDVALFKYKSNFELHLGAAYHQGFEGNIPANINSFYKDFQFVWFNKKFESFSLSALALNNGLQSVNQGQMEDKVNHSQTLGAFATTKLSGISIDASAYYQLGKDRVANSVSAYNLALNAGMNVAGNFGVKAGIEILSGTDQNSTTGKNNSFSPFYGTNHKFNGFMDYFYVGNHANTVGLNDINAGVNYKFGNWAFIATGHYFSSNANLINPVDNSIAKSYLGTELDLTLRYKLNEIVSFEGGYSQMFASDSMEILKAGDRTLTNNWAYIMITIKPSFFASSK